MQLNHIRFAGFAGRDSDKKSGQYGEFTTFSIASTKKTKEGEETTTWMNCLASGGWANYASQIKKGDNVYVEGEISVREYTAKDSGEKREGVTIKVFNMLIGSRPAADASKPKHVGGQPFGKPGQFDEDNIPF